MAEVVEGMADEGSFREKASAMRGAARTRSAMMRVVFALLVIVAFSLKLLHAYLFYGDLSCAFAECRKVVTDAR